MLPLENLFCFEMFAEVADLHLLSINLFFKLLFELNQGHFWVFVDNCSFYPDMLLFAYFSSFSGRDTSEVPDKLI